MSLKRSVAYILAGLAPGLLAAAAGEAMPMPMHHGAQPEWATFGVPGRPGAAARTIAVAASDTRFQPDDIRIRRGETIRFVVTNRGVTRHEFVIGNQAFHLQHQKEMEAMPDMKMDEANELDLAPGETRILLWQFTRPGQLSFACDIPGHAHAGMAGRFHIL